MSMINVGFLGRTLSKEFTGVGLKGMTCGSVVPLVGGQNSVCRRQLHINADIIIIEVGCVLLCGTWSKLYMP